MQGARTGHCQAMVGASRVADACMSEHAQQQPSQCGHLAPGGEARASSVRLLKMVALSAPAPACTEHDRAASTLRRLTSFVARECCRVCMGKQHAVAFHLRAREGWCCVTDKISCVPLENVRRLVRTRWHAPERNGQHVCLIVPPRLCTAAKAPTAMPMCSGSWAVAMAALLRCIHRVTLDGQQDDAALGTWRRAVTGCLTVHRTFYSLRPSEAGCAYGAGCGSVQAAGCSEHAPAKPMETPEAPVVVPPGCRPPHRTGHRRE
mmetsp:Transcript_40050/g.105892  ORF Transcript_40050/g.105892 Transcript_40050/m.105892 type:complete len:263 (-) Transcript_40050:764-1552(-)